MVALNAEVRRRAMQTATSLHRRGVVRATFVFGSHAEGRAYEWSDIDVAVFMDDVESWNLWRRTRLMTEIQKEVGFDLEVHLFPASALTEADRHVYVLFCCQQAVEKALKALIIAQTGKLAPRIHNLPRLAELASVKPEAAQLDLMADLSNFYVQSRYPDEMEPVGEAGSLDRVTKTLGETKETVEWLLSMLK